MTGFEWLLVLVPVFVVGIYLFRHRSGAETSFNSIRQSSADDGHREAADASHTAQGDLETQRSQHHGCCH